MYGTTPHSAAEDTIVRRGSAQRATEQATEHIESWVYLVAGCAALNSCSIGFDLGISTHAGPLLQNDLKLTNRQFEFFMGLLPLSSAFGCAFASSISDTYGRRASFVASNAAILVGLIIMCAGSIYGMAENIYGTLLVGRALVGIGVGLGLCIGPLYLAEISPPVHRGWLVSWNEISISIGVVFAYAVGWLCSPPSSMSTAKGWDFMFAAGGILPFLVLVLTATVMLESPRWLIHKERSDEAKVVVKKLFGDQADVSAIMREISKNLAEEKGEYDTHSWRTLMFPPQGMKRLMIMGLLCGIAQQVVGIEPIMLYMQIIIRSASGDSSWTLQSFPLVVGLVKLAVTLVSSRLMDICGRRQMMLISFGGIGATCIGVAGMFYSNYTPAGLIMKAYISYAMFFAIGAGPGAWLLSSELFPNSIRAKGMSVTACSNRCIGGVQVLFVLTIVGAVGWGTVFAFFGLASVLYCILFYFCLPETKSKTLEEMAEHFLAFDGPSETQKLSLKLPGLTNAEGY